MNIGLRPSCVDNLEIWTDLSGVLFKDQILLQRVKGSVIL